jgi:hypothetical protein
VTVNTSLEGAYGNLGRLTIVLQRYMYKNIFLGRYLFMKCYVCPIIFRKKVHIILLLKMKNFCAPFLFSCSMLCFNFSLTPFALNLRSFFCPFSFIQKVVCSVQQQQQQLSLVSQTSWGRLEMKPTENKNKKHKKGTSQRKS